MADAALTRRLQHVESKLDDLKSKLDDLTELIGRERPHRSSIRLDLILALVLNLNRKVRNHMATLNEQFDEIIADMTEQKTMTAGISTMVAGLKQQLADALAGTTLPPETQAKVDAIFDMAESNKTELAGALEAGTV